MRKRSGPSLRQQARKLGTCGQCNGKGTVIGVFHEMACFHCGGSGIVCGESGEPLADHETIMQLRIRLNWANRRIRELEDEKKPPERDDDRGHGPMGKRYHGD